MMDELVLPPVFNKTGVKEHWIANTEATNRNFAALDSRRLRRVVHTLGATAPNKTTVNVPLPAEALPGSDIVPVSATGCDPADLTASIAEGGNAAAVSRASGTWTEGDRISLHYMAMS